MDNERETLPNEIGNKVATELSPTHGCENCWGDLYQGCNDNCIAEHKEWMRIKRIVVKHSTEVLLPPHAHAKKNK